MANASTQTNLFTAATSTGQHVDRDVRVFTVDGQPWPWSIRLARSVDVLTGRPRWIGKARIAWVDRDDAGHMGVMVSDVTPTSAGAPRRLAGFDSFEPAESFDATADGSRVILSIRNTLETVAVVDRVPGIDLPRPGKAR